ncbi:MAG: hypothetical protein IKJ82_01260 [Oscillospiraceae bacterium]|nr:hypothetical protein [Oscillospiraceae bacterium]
MKKFVSIFLALVMILSFSVTAFAAETTEVSLNKYSSDDEKIIVDVDLSKKGDPCMLQFCVAYDSSVLDCVSVVSGNAFSASTAPTINKTEGKIYFVWDALSPLKDGGTVLRIEFTPKVSNKTTSIRIDDETEEFIVANENFEGIGKIKGDLEIVTGDVPSSNVPSGDSSNVDNSSKEEPGKENKPGKDNVPDNTPDEGYSNGIEIDKTQLSVDISEEAELKVSDSDKELFWFSSDENVLKVENGKIIPVGPGKATVTVMTEDGLEEATCIVTVTGELSSEEEEGSGNVLNVDSPRQEKEEGVPAWAWILIIALGAGAAAVVVVLVSKIKANKK